MSHFTFFCTFHAEIILKMQCSLYVQVHRKNPHNCSEFKIKGIGSKLAK